MVRPNLVPELGNIPCGACPPVNPPVNPPNELVAQNVEVSPASIPEALPAHAPVPSPIMTANEVATIIANMMQVMQQQQQILLQNQQQQQELLAHAHAAPGTSPVSNSPPVLDKSVENGQGVEGVTQHGSRKRPMNSQKSREPQKAPRGPYPDSIPAYSNEKDENRSSQSAQFTAAPRPSDAMNRCFFCNRSGHMARDFWYRGAKFVPYLNVIYPEQPQ
ncbi:uncharacterized protein LOC122643444 [Telopea speciosissima]|uniref:uncharacterized protein LOC122643444 n=1 Tax=Telopea speciosissima TaxID=54955 RepID=UPI001CC381C3|nr:uncharacterized protein LOC122643444 [Telopea speciosissima]